ncbi:MAG: hypothetical protein KBG15_14385 [Kofleriaceae bacterium]|nr:hypothetical protein [Kofleriaceae bacterium]
MKIVSLVLLAMVVGGCGNRVGSNVDAGASVPATLRVEPATATLVVVNGLSVKQRYEVIATFEDGTEVNVTNEASLTVPLGYGEIQAAVLRADGVLLGKTQVDASLRGVVGSAELIIKADDTRIDPVLPPNIVGLFDGATLDPNRAVTIVYPPNNVAVPRNLGDLDIHWQASTDNVFEVSLKNQFANLRVFVPATTPAHVMRFLPTEWTRAVKTDPTLVIGVRGLDQAAPATVSQSQPIGLTASNEDMQGGIYYWSTTDGAGQPGGFWRHDMIKAGDPAEPYLSATEAGQCVGCHALSRDGKKMVVRYIDGTSGLYDVATKTKIAPLPSAASHDLWTYHPSGDVVVSQFGSNLQILDGRTAAPVATVPITGNVVQPDFSPMGDQLVYVEGETSGANHVVYNAGKIVSRSYDAVNHTFGAARTIIETGDLIYYPVVSPDGQWVAYNRAAAGNSVSNLNGEVWVVKMDGTKAIKLQSASLAPGQTNSWVRWAPFEQTVNGEKVYWLSFSSTRTYGVFAGPTQPQIWMTSFSPARAEAGTDPSSPAFRLPFQNLTFGNHIGQWTTAIVPVE